MAVLLLTLANGARQQFEIYKSLTTVGSDDDADITLRIPDVAPVAARIMHAGDVFTIATLDRKAEIEVAGKRTRKQNLVDGDTLRIGSAHLQFYVEAPPQQASPTPREADLGLAAYERLLQFSRALANEPDTNALLTVLLDEIIDVCGAENGFIVLCDADGPKVRVARTRHAPSEAPETHLSDSILQKTLQTKQPLVVSDARHDAEFNASRSVVNLKLSSVMCAPLIDRGSLLGAIYVGNNRVVDHFDEASLNVLTVFAGQAALLVRLASEVESLSAEASSLREALQKGRFGSLIGACDGMTNVFRKVEKVAKADISVLVTGETGTGKELVAREIHRRSARADGPFIVINCGAIPENLLESELFGHVRGAFTGATQTRQGRFQAASGGTLFLDEIGEMPLQLQVKLLRVLQDRTVTKVGDNKPEPVDIRVLAATHRDLDAMVREGTFREDLYYRLNVVNLHLPPLRERGDDVIVLAQYLLERDTDAFGKRVKGFSKSAKVAMLRYPWPGNVRQLENRIKRALVLSEGRLLDNADLDILPEEMAEILPLSDALELFRRRYINEALERNANNRTKTARELGVDPRTVFRHLEAERSGA